MDRRIRKTKATIHKALLALLEHKDVSSIHINELCDIADVNRKTFYNHYDRVMDVLDEIEDECVSRVARLFTDERIKSYESDFGKLFSDMVYEIQKDEVFYRLLIHSNEYMSVSKKLVPYEKEWFRKITGSVLVYEGIGEELFLEFFSSGFAGVIQAYLESDGKIPAETISGFLGIVVETNDLKRKLMAIKNLINVD